MEKKRVYFAQVNHLFGNSAYLPYTAGTILAAAFSDERINACYQREKILYKRDPIESVIKQLNVPYLFAFSSYNWNHEYNKVLAQAVKQAHPECIIVFGGHHIPAFKTQMLEEYPFIDYLLFGEGEFDFPSLLLALLDGDGVESVNNLAYRKGTELSLTKRVQYQSTDFPSPYATDVFDDLLDDGYTFHTTMETNRGCPYSCGFCDYGGESKFNLRQLPMERVAADIEWMAANKIEYIFEADPNFGILPRDLEITDRLIKTKETYGFPCKLRTNSAKNSTELVFQINKNLNDAGMSKGATLSFQSLNPTVLDIIGRTNIPVEQFTQLMRLYKQAGIPTVTELIWGLPGETVESFKDGIEQMLEAGQHNSLLLYQCDWLPNTLFGNEDFMRKNKLKTVRIPNEQMHAAFQKDGIVEYLDIIVETFSMSKEDYKKGLLFSWAIQTFHCLGLLQKFAIFLNKTRGLRYVDFYGGLLEYLSNNAGLTGRIYDKVVHVIGQSIEDNGTRIYPIDAGGEIAWDREEGSFIDLVSELDVFYEETKPYLAPFFKGEEEEIFHDLIQYQKNIIRAPFKSDYSIECNYDFYHFFACADEEAPAPLTKRKNQIEMHSESFDSIFEYAVQVVWYGRKGGSNFSFIESIKEESHMVRYL